MPQKKPSKETFATDYAELGRQMENIYLSGAADTKQLLKNSFLKGIVGGVGSVLGATIVIALLLWTLSLLDTVPLVGPIFDNLEETIDTRK